MLHTTELLKNILYFTGFKTLLTSVLRVSKSFNTAVTTSPRLQKATFESFTVVAAELSDPSKHFLINDALFLYTFQFPGTMESWYFGRCCWSSSRAQTCERDHFLKILSQSSDRMECRASATSWRKLRVLLPLDNSQTCRVRFSPGFSQELSADVTLGDLYDLRQLQRKVLTYQVQHMGTWPGR